MNDYEHKLEIELALLAYLNHQRIISHKMIDYIKLFQRSEKHAAQSKQGNVIEFYTGQTIKSLKNHVKEFPDNCPYSDDMPIIQRCLYKRYYESLAFVIKNPDEPIPELLWPFWEEALIFFLRITKPLKEKSVSPQEFISVWQRSAERFKDRINDHIMEIKRKAISYEKYYISPDRSFLINKYYLYYSAIFLSEPLFNLLKYYEEIKLHYCFIPSLNPGNLNYDIISSLCFSSPATAEYLWNKTRERIKSSYELDTRAISAEEYSKSLIEFNKSIGENYENATLMEKILARYETLYNKEQTMLNKLCDYSAEDLIKIIIGESEV